MLSHNSLDYGLKKKSNATLDFSNYIYDQQTDHLLYLNITKIIT